MVGYVEYNTGSVGVPLDLFRAYNRPISLASIGLLLSPDILCLSKKIFSSLADLGCFTSSVIYLFAATYCTHCVFQCYNAKLTG